MPLRLSKIFGGLKIYAFIKYAVQETIYFQTKFT